MRASALPAAAVAAVLLLVGCSSAAPTTAPVGTTTTTGAVAAPTTTTTTTSGAAAGQAVDKAAFIRDLGVGNAAVKTMTTTTEASIKMGETTNKTEMVMQIDQSVKDRLRAKLTMDIGIGEMAVVMDGDDYYMQMDGTWYKTSKAQMEKAGQPIPDTEDQAGTLARLEGKIQKVVYVGPDTVDGVATKHYQLTLDGSAFGDLGTGATAAPTTDTLPYDLWVDGNNVMRKFVIALKDDDSDITMTGVITKINEPVSIEIPKDAQAFPS